jgi:peptidoglycan LD-endopeptidase LytH
MSRRVRQLPAWQSALSLLGIGFGVGALTLAAAQGQFSGGSRSVARTPGGPPPAIVQAPPQPSSAVAGPAAIVPGARDARKPPAGAVATTGLVATADVTALRLRDLDVPVEGVSRADIQDTYRQARGSRVHEAVDILAPRGTSVRAVEDGTIARLFFSKAGGITIYQFDPTSQFCYYYAHLDRYADGLTEGQAIRRGQVIGHVGTTGNAPKNTPHLHFAIFRLNEDKRWWDGEPIDPFQVFKP